MLPCSLLHWIAYWAAGTSCGLSLKGQTYVVSLGWHINVTHYYHKIYTILVQMHATFKTMLWANQPYADDYLNSWAILNLEGIMRSIKTLPEGSGKEPKLTELAESMRNSQEALILSNLKEVSFILESPADVAIVTGEGRVEKVSRIEHA